MPNVIPVILITGASRGLGRGIAVHAAKMGCSAIINYTSDEKAARETVRLCVQNRLNEMQRFVPFKADIGSSKDRAKLVKQTLKEFGRIDALVNNAGIGPRVRKDVTETTEESFSEVLKVNLHGTFFLTQSVANYWLRETLQAALPNGFKIVFISSISAETASVNRGEYCISKAGLSMVSRLWATRLANHGIQVFELRPGIMATDMTTAVKEHYDKLLAEGLVPNQRWGTADDVGQAVSSILAGNFPFSTGEVIHIDGGLHIPRL